MSTVSVHIKTASGAKHTVQINLEGTVADLRKAVEEASQVPADQQRLIFKGKVLRDAMTLTEIGLEAESTVHMVRSVPATSTATATPTPTSAPAPAPAPAPGVLPPFGGFGGAPMPGFGGAPAPNPFGGFPGMMGGMDAQGGMPDVGRMQQQLLQNPEMMRSIMSSPMMQNLMSNPDLIRNMIMNNPQMRQVLDANPQLNHVLNDPALMRQAMEYMQNPQAMQQMMRSQDLAMSQIENHPEGFNALRRMYTEVNEPMYEAMAQGFNQQQSSTASGTSTSSAGVNSSGSGPNTAALPNPWASARSGAGTGTATAPTTGTGTGAPPPLFPNPLMNPFGGSGATPPMPSMDTTMQMMQNPMMQAMMQQMLSDPAYLDQMAASNPMLRQMMDQNPHVRQMMSSPEFIRQVTDPANMQAMMQLQRSGLINPQQMGLGGGFGGGGFGGFGAPPSTGTANPPMGGLDFSSLLSQYGGNPAMGTGTTAAPGTNPFPTAVAPAVDPATRFATQLQQLRDMGFTDQERSIQALLATNGNVNAAVDRLLSGGS